jgi:hypothetical protein
MKLSNVNPKRQTKRLLEVNERIMLMALENQLDVELNVLSDLLTVASKSVTRTNVSEVIQSLRLDIGQSDTVISELRNAILEIKDNDPTAKSRLVSDIAKKLTANFAADDIPF